MQITFAGTIIAQEPDFGGFDAVTGFIPKGKGNTEWQEFLRAADAKPIARSNRKRTLSGKIVPAPSTSLAEAMVLRSTAHNNLPDQGDLIIRVGNSIVTFAGAVLEAHEAIEDLQGVAAGFQLSFAVGKGGAATTQNILTQSGAPLLSQAGTPILNQGS